MPTTSNTKNASLPDKASFKNPAVIINSKAGSTSDISSKVSSIFKHFKYPEPVIHYVEPSELDASFDTVSSDGTDLLVIYGGDGTCNSGAIVARKAGIPLIALPGGTMNMLPKALYGTDDWEDALKLALSQTAPRWQAAGNINDKVFFCGAIMGDPIVMSDARESLRDGDVMDAVKQIPEIMNAIAHGDKFEFKVDGKLFDRDANALHLSCPYMSLGATKADAFELASAPQLSVSELIGIGARALSQDWRESELVNVTEAKEITIKGQGAFDVLLDGEPERVTCPIRIILEEQGVLVLAPDLNTKAK